MVEQNVAPGIHRLEVAFTNFYLVEDEGGVTIVDACVPTAWEPLHEALRAIGRAPGDVRALVLTHAHFDHLGFAERARSELLVPVYVHENDVPLTRHPLQYSHERARSRYFLTQFAPFRSSPPWFGPAPSGPRRCARCAATSTARCPCPARLRRCSPRATPSGTARFTSPTATR